MKDSFDFTASQRTKYCSATPLLSAAPCDFAERDAAERELWSRRVALKGDIEKEVKLTMLARPGELTLRLTDVDDPLFLFFWDIEERGYAQFRAEQQLRVDFALFAARLAQLLDLAERRGDSGVSFAVRVARRECGRLLLRVCESNDFKELDHLSLVLAAAGEERLRRYLAARVRETVAELSAARAAADGLRGRVDAAVAESDELRLALERAESDRRAADERRSRELQARVEHERSLFAAERAQLVDRALAAEAAAEELRAIRAAAAEQFEESAATALSRERELKARLRAAEAEAECAAEEAERARKAARAAETRAAAAEDAFETERKAVERMRVAAERAETEIAAVRGELAETTQSAARFRAETAEKARLCERLESKVKLCSAEINKANEIMEKFEGELQRRTEKLKATKSRAARAEATVSELRAENALFASQLENAAASDDALSAARAKQSALEARVAELEQALEASQSSIAFLTQKVAEQSRPFLAAPSHPWIAAANGLSPATQALLRGGERSLGSSLARAVAKERPLPAYLDRPAFAERAKAADEELTFRESAAELDESREEFARVISPIRFKSKE